jgi:hypothetical protein
VRGGGGRVRLLAVVSYRFARLFDFLAVKKNILAKYGKYNFKEAISQDSPD